MRGASDAHGLEIALDRPLPTALPVGPATAVFCIGSCFHRNQRIADLAIVVDGVRQAPTAQRMPRLDREPRRALPKVGTTAGQASAKPRMPESGDGDWKEF